MIINVINMNFHACCVFKKFKQAFKKYMFLLNYKQTVYFYLNTLIKSV